MKVGLPEQMGYHMKELYLHITKYDLFVFMSNSFKIMMKNDKKIPLNPRKFEIILRIRGLCKYYSKDKTLPLNVTAS